MTLVEQFARLEHKLRPFLTSLNPALATWLMSYGRKPFLSLLANDKSQSRVDISSEHRVNLWDIEFNVPLFNAAGMFKNGDAYYMVASQGAGAYLAGTTTKLPRTGNIKSGIRHPVVSFPKSNIAVNWMGLPNEGHEVVADRLSRIDKQKGCPVGASISSDPSQTGAEALAGILSGLENYTKAGVDFIELNESCPNVEHEHSNEIINGLDKTLVDRLEFVSSNFIKNRERFVPLIVKFSNDTLPGQIPALIDLLLTLGFDGVNFGNTSINYKSLKSNINPSELKLFNYFVSSFGGGVSGKALKSNSFALSSLAVGCIKKKKSANEFHIIRTGGIEDVSDIYLSKQVGIELNQWFTGYFGAFAKYGHNLYKEIFDSLPGNNLS